MTREFIENKLLPIIRSAFDISSEQPELSQSDLNTLLQFGTRQSILPIIWRGMKRFNYPAECMLQFENARMNDIRNFVVRQFDSENIFKVLESAGISYIPLKGAVIKELYPEPWMRTSCDIDILVHEEDLDKAVSSIANGTDFSAGKRGYHDISMLNSRVHLELHFSIKETIESIDQMLGKAWDYAERKGSSCCFVFTPEFQIFHVLAHMSYHLRRGGLGMRPFLDLWLLKEKTHYNESELQTLCEKCGIWPFYKKSCELLNSWMANDKYTPESEALEQYCLMGGVYGNSEIASAAVLRENTGIRYYFRRLFIKKEALQELYPRLRDKPLLLPYYEIKRWFRLLNKTKRKRIFGELKGVHTINKDQIDSFDKLLTSLGL